MALMTDIGASLLAETLRNRKTDFDTDSFKRILKLVDDSDIQVRWRYFQKTINQTGLSLSDVMRLIDEFLHPVFDSVVNRNIFSRQWDAKQRRWEL
jgi:hypothetical protein